MTGSINEMFLNIYLLIKESSVYDWCQPAISLEGKQEFKTASSYIILNIIKQI